MENEIVKKICGLCLEIKLILIVIIIFVALGLSHLLAVIYNVNPYVYIE